MGDSTLRTYSGCQYEVEHSRGDLRGAIRTGGALIGSGGTQQWLLALGTHTASATRRRHQYGSWSKGRR